MIPRTRPVPAARQGFGLIELVVAVVVLAVSVVGVLSVMNFTVARSADPAVQVQATLIAEAYLEEILLKPFVDPSAGTTRACPTPETSGRIAYDNVCDYNGLANAGARDQFNNPVSGLEDYTVSVTVTGDTSLTLGPSGADQVDNSTVLRLLRVDVRVQGPGGTDLTLTGYRTNYNCNAVSDTACLPL